MRRKIIFLQDWGPYNRDTVVVVGMNNAEIVAWLKKNANAEGVKEVIKDFATIGKPKPDSVAFVYEYDNKSIMWLGWEWKHRMSNLANLVHETNHLVYNMVRAHGMVEECEAQAYLQAWLFEEISRKLGVKSNVRGKTDDRRTSQRKPTRLPRLRPDQEGTGA